MRIANNTNNMYSNNIHRTVLEKTAYDTLLVIPWKDLNFVVELHDIHKFFLFSWHSLDNCADNLSLCRQSPNFSFASWQLKKSHTITCLMSVSPTREYFSAESLIKTFLFSAHPRIFTSRKFDQHISFTPSQIAGVWKFRVI